MEIIINDSDKCVFSIVFLFHWKIYLENQKIIFLKYKLDKICLKKFLYRESENKNISLDFGQKVISIKIKIFIIVKVIHLVNIWK